MPCVTPSLLQPADGALGVTIGCAAASLESAARPVYVEPAQARPSMRRHVLGALLISLLLLAAFMHVAHLRIVPLERGNLPFYAAGLILLTLRCALPGSAWRHGKTVAQFSEYVAIFTIIALMGATASYPVAALTHGYADTTLQAIDVALGFDWLSWYRLVAAHPVLQALGTVAYRSIYVTPALLLWFAARAGRQDKAYRFMACFWVATIITLAVFTLMPAVGPFSHLWHEPIVYMPESEQWQSGLIPALRAHGVHVVDFGTLRGIVSAPSFHTAAAVLYIVAAWRIEALRWPIIALNAAMLLSTPVEGTHYFIDMILGVVVALASLTLVRFYEQALCPRVQACG